MWTIAPDGTRPGFIYLATQPDMYHATLPFLRKGLRKLAAWADANATSVALPKIGSGLGKLDWTTQVKPLFTQFLTESETKYIVYEDYDQTRDG
jgi:O-acetyl-ADP-ribose deacetylase (regulator of RNase III)